MAPTDSLLISLIEHIDSLATAIDTVARAGDAAELLNRVEAVYDRRWTHLLWFMGVAVGVVGVLVPLIIQKWQRSEWERQLESIETENAELQKRIDQYAQTANEEIESIRAGAEEQLDATRKALQAEIKLAAQEAKKEATQRASALTLVVAGASAEADGRHRVAADFWLLAATASSRVHDWDQLRDYVGYAARSFARRGDASGLDDDSDTTEETIDDLSKAISEAPDDVDLTSESTKLAEMRAALPKGPRPHPGEGDTPDA